MILVTGRNKAIAYSETVTREQSVWTSGPLDQDAELSDNPGMGLKIKWNDDRVRGAMTAILLIGRDRLGRGQTADLVQASLAEYRDDPEGYKMKKAAWADARELGPLKKPAQVAYYKNLISAVDALLKKMEQGKRQSNSLLELDNYLVSSLRNVR